MIKHLDLNLLPALNALLKERNVTRAANQIGLSQPAMSRVLAKLREQFEDQLLVRVGIVFQLTPKAISLLQKLNKLIPELQQLQYQDDFCPHQIAQTINIAGTDMDIVLLAKNINTLQNQAPNLAIAFKQSHFHILDSLLQGDIDFAITTQNDERSGLHRRLLWQQSYVVIVSSESIFSASTFSLDDYLAQKHGSYHLSASHDELANGMVDTALAGLGKQREVTLRLPNFTQIPAFIKNSKMMFTVPKYFAENLAQYNPIKILPLPFAVPLFNIYLYWHSRLHKDPLHQWLRRFLEEKQDG